MLEWLKWIVWYFKEPRITKILFWVTWSRILLPEGHRHHLKNKVLLTVSKGNIESSNAMAVSEGEWCSYVYLKQVDSEEIWSWRDSADTPLFPIFFSFLLQFFFFLRSFNSARKEKSSVCKAVDKLLYWDMVVPFASCRVVVWYPVLRTKPLSPPSSQETAQQTSEGRRGGKRMLSTSTQLYIQWMSKACTW